MQAALQDGHTDRICSAAETFRRIEPLLPRYGITRLARLTGLDRIGIPVWNAVAPNAKSITISQGKGIRDIDAKVSAAMEALERAVAGAPEVEILADCWKTLSDAGKRAERLPGLIAAGQDDIGDDERIAWVNGIHVVSGGPVFLPYQAAILDSTQVQCRFWQSSDGLASGNTLEEAILHGLLERVERDAHVLWQVAPDKGMGGCIDPLAFHEPIISEMMEKIAAAGLILRLFDITTDIGIPCYTALLAPANFGDLKNIRFLDVTHGSGAHPDPARAVMRAITEAAQSRLTFISGARDDIHPATFNRPLPEEIRARLMTGTVDIPVRNSVFPSGARALLNHTLRRLEEAGIVDVFAVPLTRPETPFSVAKIFVPQLEHPEGPRKRRFGGRAISRSLGIA